MLLLTVASVARAGDTKAPLMNPLFQDHAVLQRDRPVPVWGHAAAGQVVTVSIDGKQAHARADADGRWRVELPALDAGGPYTLTAKSADGSREVAHDVLVGDVWLCSGQSNMELPVKRTLNWPNEVANAHDGAIRMLTVGKYASVTPRTDFATPAVWQKASPETVADFSATCYYFARALKQHVDVPMGLINASWGGAKIQAWMSAKALRSVGGYGDILDILDEYATDPVAANARWGRFWESWWRKHPGWKPGDEPWEPGYSGATGWRKAPPGLGDWNVWGVPELAGFTGMVWFRTTVELSAAQAAKGAVLSMGMVDEIDQTWVNGRAVGSAYIGTPRHYRLPQGLLHAGANTIVVNVLNTYREGGILGPASTRALHFDDGGSVPLDGTWTYRIVPKSAGEPPTAPWLSASGDSTLYNGMIAPLGDYAVRGGIWYQGASNTTDAESYATYLRAYRRQMRAQFGDKMPLLIVQLANYGPPPVHPGESGWAEVREAEREVANDDAYSALAVTIDTGGRDALHPADKQELGLRLARAARHVVYGEKSLSASGPVPLSARHAGDVVRVRFGGIEKGLVAYGADGPVGFELCGTGVGSCHYADATIHGDVVTLRAPNAASATRVRYGWADNPVVTLFDGNGLPAGPFQLPIPSPQ
ncbi:MAG TPA: sialate O-acetylesterase [Rhodanobacteraceae bacterium]|nr:sialate O-acetylesterase [Rhodanobacteraceae bacterium]